MYTGNKVDKVGRHGGLPFPPHSSFSLSPSLPSLLFSSYTLANVSGEYCPGTAPEATNLPALSVI